MSAWWTKIKGVVKRHDGRKPKLGAVIAATFAKAAGTPIEELGLYRKDPAKYPDAVNELPDMLEKAARRGR